MSNFLAVATVTAALSQALLAAVLPDLDGSTVTTIRPDSNGGLPTTGVNIFLYQVTPNAAWQNADLPTRRAGGELVQRPQAALDLHYLLTFYGDDTKLVPQRLLGSVVRALHSKPILTRKLIRDTIAKADFNFLVKSNLADSIELIKLTPITLSLEELSKLWSVYFQTHYSLSVAYLATVVLIESEESTQAALPVRARNIYVETFRQPLIEEVKSTDPLNPAIVTSSTVVITGKRLRGDVTQATVGGINATAKILSVSDTEIRMTLPAELRAGVRGLQIIHPRMMGAPAVEHTGVQSNLAAFVLHPIIKKTGGGDPDVTIAAGKATIQISPKVSKTQNAFLLLNELNAPVDRAPRAYRIESEPHNKPADPEETGALVFPLAGVKSGDYLARMQIDGADSPLEQSADVNNPVYTGPKITIA
jgi:Pvc16 N-terminal domain